MLIVTPNPSTTIPALKRSQLLSKGSRASMALMNFDRSDLARILAHLLSERLTNNTTNRLVAMKRMNGK